MDADVILLEPFHVNEKLFNISLKTNRISRGVIGMTGSLYTQEELDDKYKV